MMLSNTISRFVGIVFSLDEQFVPYKLDVTHSGPLLRVDHTWSLTLLGALGFALELYSKILFEVIARYTYNFPVNVNNLAMLCVQKVGISTNEKRL